MNIIAKESKQTQPSLDGSSAPRLGWLEMMGSSLAAAFGVQSRKNKERDFTRGDIKRFFITGVVLTLVFLFSMMGIVKLVLSF